MKFFLLAPLLAVFLSRPGTIAFHPGTTDTTIINHILDGSISEWPVALIVTDKDEGVSYAIDNDASNLYLVLSVPNVRAQVKLMRQGMSLYVDLKNKKKKGKGIEFPVKREDGGNSGGFNSNGTGNQRNFDPGAYRSAFALNMIKLKLFGFTDGDAFPQGLQEKGSANIAFAWDSASGMHIEYSIPLAMLDDKPKSLDKKEISVGWKINGVDLPSGGGATPSVNVAPSRGVGPGSRPSGGGFSGGGSSQAERAKEMEEQNIWTKYTFHIPAGM